MFFRDNLRKAWVFVLAILGLFFISETAFVNFYPLLGSLFVGFLLKRDYDYAGFFMLLSLVPVFVDHELALSFTIYYPFLFVILVLMFRDYGMNNKGEFFLALSVGIGVIFLVYLLFMEKQIGLFSKMIGVFKIELSSLGTQLKGNYPSDEVQSYYSLLKEIVEKYSLFLITLQFVIYNILNLYILSILFKDLLPPFSERFGSMQIPIWGLWGINFGLILYLFFELPYSNYGINIVLFFLSIYFFQGLSLSVLFFKLNKIPAFIMFFFIFLLLLNQVIWLFISIIGILDTYFNFKKHFKEAVL